MNQFPETGFLREKQILGDKKSKPPVPAIIPGFAHNLVERSRHRALPQAGETRAACYRVESRGHSRPDCIGIGDEDDHKEQGPHRW